MLDFDVILSIPTGDAPLNLGGFSYGMVLTGGTGAEYSDVVTSPTTPAYVFSGDSFVDIAGDPLSFDVPPSGTAFVASDFTDSGLDIVLNPGESVSLGRVSIDVPATFTEQSRAGLIFVPSQTSLSINGAGDELLAELGQITLIHGSIGPVVTPEPAALAMYAAGLAMLAAFGRARWRRSRV